MGIPDENPFIFARSSRLSLEHMRAWDCLQKFATECESPLSNTTNITSTKLRKYITTISQVLSLKETEVDWLARHFGHDIQVHRDFYRLHESTSEIAKVSKLLLTIDQGETKKNCRKIAGWNWFKWLVQDGGEVKISYLIIFVLFFHFYCSSQQQITHFRINK